MPGIYTRKGDTGTSSLANGNGVAKGGPHLEALGDMDEANSLLGLARPPIIDSELDNMLEFVQQRLFNCGAILAGTPSEKSPKVTQSDIDAIESEIDRLSAQLGGFNGFYLPGCRDEASARLHVARAAVRRAERSVHALADIEKIDPMVLAFLNRTSDLLYAAARYSGAGSECKWDPEAPPPPRSHVRGTD